MRIDSSKTYRLSVPELKRLLGIPADEYVKSVYGNPVVQTGCIEILTSAPTKEADLLAP